MYLRPRFFVSIETVRKPPDIRNSLEVGNSLFIDWCKRQSVGSARHQRHVELPVIILRRESEKHAVGARGQPDFLPDFIPDAGPSLGVPPTFLEMDRDGFLPAIDLPDDGLAVDVQDEEVAFLAMEGILRLDRIVPFHVGLDGRADFQVGVSVRYSPLFVYLAEDVVPRGLGFRPHELRGRHAACENGSNDGCQYESVQVSDPCVVSAGRRSEPDERLDLRHADVSLESIFDSVLVSHHRYREGR